MSPRRAALASAIVLLLAPLPALADAGTAPALDERVQPWLADELRAAPADRPMRVMISGTSTATATAAARTAGLRVQQTFGSAGVVVAVGLPAQVRRAASLPGVSYVEGDQPLELTLDSVHKATLSDVALATQRTPSGAPVDGRGISVAVIDTGIDGTHPFFRGPDGKSKIVVNKKNACTAASLFTGEIDGCFQSDPTGDSDTDSGGGHGTHVAGIVGGFAMSTTGANPVKVRGAAPGAKIVGLSVGASLFAVNAVSAQNWVLEHQHRPCRAANDQNGPIEPDCPPIRVTNHSYGSGTRFDPNSAAVRLQRALAAKGVVAVWSAGNDGGNGSRAVTNAAAMDPTPGILMVASYNDRQAGDRDHQLSEFSSRGQNGEPSTYPDLAAPGDRIISACRPYLTICSTGFAPRNGPGDGDLATFNTISGTSMAAPYVAGVVAQLFQADPRLTPAQVELLLEDSAHRFTAGAAYEADEPERNPRTPTSFDKGHGLIDVDAALTLLRRRH